VLRARRQWGGGVRPPSAHVPTRTRSGRRHTVKLARRGGTVAVLRRLVANPRERKRSRCGWGRRDTCLLSLANYPASSSAESSRWPSLVRLASR
jgi:hypothetical protein